MRDISSYDVKKVKFDFATGSTSGDEEDKNDTPVVQQTMDSKNRRVALKNKKADDFNRKREGILAALDLNDDENDKPIGKLAKQVAL